LRPISVFDFGVECGRKFPILTVQQPGYSPLGQPPLRFTYDQTGRFKDISTDIMTGSRMASAARPKHHNQWLILIAAFKLLQALLAVVIGIGALQLLHKDVGDELTRLVDYLRFNPESRIVNFILDHASQLNDHILRQIGAGGVSYAGLLLVEGIGLYLEKTWAEYLTLAVTGSFLPWEIFELWCGLTIGKCTLLVVNALVFIYLFNLVIGRRRSVNEEPFQE
jgi:uncharacterized membrane protein (DUF2068 family)